MARLVRAQPSAPIVRVLSKPRVCPDQRGSRWERWFGLKGMRLLKGYAEIVRAETRSRLYMKNPPFKGGSFWNLLVRLHNFSPGCSLSLQNNRVVRVKREAGS